ncbi:hypothetical protein F4778DRAFT_798742 [Xylariomycetidae sp. FL2044]|nr:hypothetical protein F4778DRAFT_798742 [Xylariomycetidae sp. FL2044]
MDVLHAVFNHLVLPPQTPGEPDPDIDAVSHNVLTRIIRACEGATALVDPSWSETFRGLQVSSETCLALNAGRLERSTLIEHFRKLRLNHVLILYVVEQNVALLVRREDDHDPHRVVFEAFETSATSEQVLASDHALVWDFPGHSAQLPMEQFADASFQESLAVFLEQASMESLYSLQASTRKANVSVTETRDTTDPALITQMLMPLLEALGSHFQAPLLRKRVRDEANIGGANLPWRRLPLWLVLRVAAQRQLGLALGSEQGRFAYKALMCLLLADLLKESAGSLSPDLVMLLRAKLCRRMAKLEMDHEEVESTSREAFASFFEGVKPIVAAAIEDATAQVETAWNRFKHGITRHIPKLPLRAPDASLRLSLPNSGTYLDGLLSYQPPQRVDITSTELPRSLGEGIRRSQKFTDHIFGLAELEARVYRDDGHGPAVMHDRKHLCTQLARQMDKIFTEVGTTYDKDPAQVSGMILALFTLWVRLDRSAVKACPLLRDHRPAFSPELLDALHLPTKIEMQRLQDIQIYLNQRQSESRYGSVFDKLDGDCLAVRYVAQSVEMQSLGTRIQSASDEARRVKKQEWEQKCAEYDQHTDAIQVQEDFLPDNSIARAVMLFELAIPKYLAAYRDATWQILVRLGHPGRPRHHTKPVIKLEECSPLKTFMAAEMEGVSLASTVKCFDQTHYKFYSGKAPLSRVILPLGAKFQLYDHAAGLWVQDMTATPLTLQHLCGIYVPQGLRATILPLERHPPPVIDGPSSYEIQANQTECPSDMSVHEFSAFQKLLAGHVRRWPNILVEMGSSNLNFSSEDVMRVLSHLAVQAGPFLLGEPLRAIHAVFKEPLFLERLAEMIENRLHIIRANWRDHSCMELLVTLSLRLFSLSQGEVSDRAKSLLKAARDATLEWTIRLREELRSATDANVARRLATYGFCAALLCRRTFTVYCQMRYPISPEDLCTWTQASIALQENMVVDVDDLPQHLKGMLMRDAKMAYHLQRTLRNGVETHPDSVGVGISRSWSETEGITTTFSQWTFLTAPNGRWIVGTTSRSRHGFQSRQTVHFNIVDGHLLVDGKSRGKLPTEISESQTVKELFGDRHLLTYPSSWAGMTHRVASLVNGQEVHFGMRGDQVIVRAWASDGVREFVPKEKFNGPENFDLPDELVRNCAHWLNITTRCLEIRRSPTIWIKRPRDWQVDIPRRVASRGNVSLVDPQSEIFSQVAGILRHFAQPESLTVYQPHAQRGRLTAALRHLELSFFVNDNSLFECQQLKAEIDPDQDAGTWYGLESKIVLRDVVSGDRSVIVPLGEVTFRRRGMHVDVRVASAQEYGKYKIDNILGRLSCPPEPRLLYTKALCHAVTSFCLPDPLTSRTGTEEAFAILRSGNAQPWTPLGSITHPILKTLEKLAPRREYYPVKLKRLQRVTWNEKLTTMIQHDGYESIIGSIMERSNQLNEFAKTSSTIFAVEQPTHLRCRGMVQRELYERVAGGERVVKSMTYLPRDRKTSLKASNVHAIVRLFRTRCSSFHMEAGLKTVLESSPVIGGFPCNGSTPTSVGPLISQIEEPIHEQWGELVDFCRHAKSEGAVMFRLGLLAFNPNCNMDAIRSLAAFAILEDLKSLPTPIGESFVDFKSRGKPGVQLLQNLMIQAHHASRPWRAGARGIRDRDGRTAQEHQVACEEETKKLADHILKQWPVSAKAISTSDLVTEVIDTSLAQEAILSEWERRCDNRELERYVDQVQRLLNQLQGPRDPSTPSSWVGTDPVFVGKRRPQIVPTLLDEGLIAKPGPSVREREPDLLPASQMEADSSQPMNALEEVAELEGILHKYTRSSNSPRQQYGGDLLRSLAALKSSGQNIKPVAKFLPLTHLELIRTIEKANKMVESYQKEVSAALMANDCRSVWLDQGALWPSMAPVSLLQMLRSSMPHEYGPGMKEALVAYGLSITNLQRLCRIKRALLASNGPALSEELRNPGHENWSPVKQPDWLLLEIDGDFLLRSEQVDVAWAIISPSSEENSVLQMSMGKGKTSCVSPAVAAFLADGNNLLRLIVPKALLLQTAQTLQDRLGDLVGRDVRHIPFSRKTEATPKMLQLYSDLHKDAHGGRGLILTSHEHMLSYKLGGRQHLADGNLDAAGMMIDFQHWLDDHCRDVLDECDFTLSVKTQLNYPSGSEMAVDGHPYRWTVAQEVLSLVLGHLPALCKAFPASIETFHRPRSFPVVHFLKQDAEDALHERILDAVSAGRTGFMRPKNSSFSSRRDIIRRVLNQERFDQDLFMQATKAFANPQAASTMLLIIRGLLRHRLLVLCLNKRWNVQYGLHPNRRPVAVPFEAKGVPSDQSEFGHPDVAILLTCLAFYYTGLTLKQLREGLQLVLQSDDPSAQYEIWISSCDDLAAPLRHWNMVNVDDEAQIQELWQYLHLNRVVINHYMNHFVFPAYAKQFAVKLQASAWDVPLFDESAGQGAKTTGFSGTNDNRMLLPLTIRQDDLPSLRQTSAEVLTYLLQRRNRGYQATLDTQGRRLTEAGLLKRLHDRRIRILIDAGAYILEMENKTLAKTWLTIDHEAKAAVYFGSDNRLWVHYRGETKSDTPLLATPFADDLDGCVIYLDEVHTRGVDLKLPANAHGALTLALKQTKDATMQAAMRLRQLGTTQSVTFFAPPEVDQNIKDFCRLGSNSKLDSAHVISWLLEQTCRVNEDLNSLYMAQGLDFCRRTDAEWRHRDPISNAPHRARLIKVLQQPERQTLEEMYGGAAGRSPDTSQLELTSRLQVFADQLAESGHYDGAVQIEATQEVEQERQAQVQIEQVRQVQRPTRYGALPFPGLHPTVLHFARAGVLQYTGPGDEASGIEHIFTYIAKSSIGRSHGVNGTDSKLFVSKEFGKTVKLRDSVADHFIRPVEWVLWNTSTQTGLVIIPEEVELLIPILRLDEREDNTSVHLIAYAAPVTKAMICFDRFQYYSLPSLPADHKFPDWFRIELGILAGRLYIDVAEWETVVRYLQPPSDTALEHQEDGFGPDTMDIATAPVKFASNPASFLMDWLALRRKTRDVLHTPMGYICTGRRIGDSTSF